MPHIGDNEHTLLSPSRYPRFELCVGSVAMEEFFPNGSNKYADKGTAQHILFQMVFNNDQMVKGEVVKEAHTHDFIGAEIVVGDTTYVVDFDFAEPVQTFIDRVRSYVEPGDILLVEQRVDYSDDIGIPGQSGTADIQIVKVARKALWVIDAKFGVQPVYAIKNGQCRLYGVGSLNQLELAYEIETIRNEIIQPALDYGDADEYEPNFEELTVAELREWVMDVAAPIFQEAYAIYQRVHMGISPPEGVDLPEEEWGKVQPFELVAGEKQCFFCRAKGACPAYAQWTVGSVADEFVDLDAEHPVKALSAAVGDITLLSNTDLAKRLKMVPFVQNWATSILALADTRLLGGQEVPGFKVVMGKKGDRKWKDDPAIEPYLRRKLGKDGAFVSKLISPPQAEKVLDAKSWAYMEKQGYVTQADGKPAVVAEDDKRPAISVGAKTTDFPALVEATEPEDLSDLA